MVLEVIVSKKLRPYILPTYIFILQHICVKMRVVKCQVSKKFTRRLELVTTYFAPSVYRVGSVKC